jgi:hypothetical protein
VGSADSWLVVRRSRWLALGVLVASLAIYVPLLGPALVGARTMVATPVVLRTEPWSAQAPLADQKRAYVAQDTVDFYLPKLSVFVDALRHGDLATWEPYSAGGSPLASVPVTASLSPLSLPYWVLPLKLAPAWVRLLEVLCAVGFMALFLRRLGLSGAAAWTGGLIYSTTGFVVLWNNWPQAGVAALVPSLFWAVERLLQRRTATAAVPVALSVAALWLASFPAVVVYALYLLFPYVLVRTLGHGASAQDVLRRWLRVSAGVGLGLALAAIQILPFVKYLGTLDLRYRAQTPGSHAPVQELLTVVAPYLFGTAAQTSYFGYRDVTDDIAYVGVVAMGLVLVGLALRVPLALPRRVTGFFVVATGVLAVVGWGSDRALGAAQHLPFIDTSYIGRIRVVLGFCLTVLAAVGADKLLRVPAVRAPWRRWFPLPLAVALLVVFLLLRSAHHTAVLRHATSVFREGLAGPAAVAALTATVLLMATLRGRAGMVAVGLLPILLAVEGLAFIGPSWPSEDPDQFYPTTPVHDFLAAHLGHERFGAAGAVLLPGSSSYYRLRDVGGHSFVSPTWHQEIAAIDPLTTSGPTLSLLGEGLDTATSPLLDRMGTKYFVVRAEHPVFGLRVSAPPAHGHTGPVNQLSARLAPGPLRAIIIGLSAPLQGEPRGSIDVVLRDAAGDVVARARREAVAAGTTGAIPVPLVESPALARATTVSITLNGLSAQVPTDVAGNPVVGLVRPANDGLRLVLAAGSVIYERLRELPRVHLATTPVVRPQREQLALLQRGLPPTTVVLDHDGPAGGGTGQVAVRTDRPERLEVTTDTTGGTWLVVSEAMQHGWVAAVDGKRVPLEPADYSGVAVALPAGRHLVTIRCAAPGFAAGRWISLLSALILLAIGVRAGVARHAVA